MSSSVPCPGTTHDELTCWKYHTLHFVDGPSFISDATTKLLLFLEKKIARTRVTSSSCFSNKFSIFDPVDPLDPLDVLDVLDSPDVLDWSMDGLKK